MPSKQAREKGYPISLYLDARENKYIEEFSTSNFVTITKNQYITPKSDSILQSITNMSLKDLSRKKFGIEVVERDIEFLKEAESFEEVGAVGTAVIITPISEFH